MNSTSIMKTVSNRPNQTYYTTKPTKPNHEINPNKPTRPNLLNKTYQNKTTKTYKHKYALFLAKTEILLILISLNIDAQYYSTFQFKLLESNYKLNSRGSKFY